MADDMGIGDTSAYQEFTGNADDVQLATPQMERLARMGVKFTDAHTPSSRCSPTRYGLLTGRYPWRNRLKYWVLFGSQGDPMIEPDRPTLGTLFQNNGYKTAIVGKWHVGLRYHNAEGKPAAEFLDADLSKPMHTSPVDHGFGFVRVTSRSHATSGPSPSRNSKKDPNTPEQNKGPGHIHGRKLVSFAGPGRKLVDDGPDAYVLNKLGSRHSDGAIEWLDSHLENEKEKPFFLYYPANSNHSPYTPDEAINGVPVAGASRTKSGASMDARHDYVYENDVALGRFIDYLSETADPRNAGSKLIDNTIVIFTSDNGAEITSKVATGPFRSNKGSIFEGGHRVPFITAWKNGNIGNGDETTDGLTNKTPIGLIDLYATFAAVLGDELPDSKNGHKGAEDSFNILPALKGETLKNRSALLFNDHKELKKDAAAVAIRVDSPKVGDKVYPGQWKQFFNANLLRLGNAEPFALYELKSDQKEETNRLEEADLQPLVVHLSHLASDVRNSGGTRLAEFAPEKRVVFDWAKDDEFKLAFADKDSTKGLSIKSEGIKITVQGVGGETFSPNPIGLGLAGGDFKQVDSGEALHLSFDTDVIIESVGIIAGNGTCGGFYQIDDGAPLSIYCIDADNDAKEQQGLLSDIGVLKKGSVLKLNSSPHYGVEPKGAWRLQSVTVRPLE